GRWVTARRSWPPPAIGLPTIPTSSCPRSGSSRRMSSFTSTDERTSRRSPRACSGWAPNPRCIKKSPDERKRTGEQLEELVQDRGPGAARVDRGLDDLRQPGQTHRHGTGGGPRESTKDRP